MYAVITKAGIETLYKTYDKSTDDEVRVEDTNKVNWDHSENGMHDHYSAVTTDSETEVELFAELERRGASLVIPAGETGYSPSKHGFDSKVASFIVRKA